MWLRTRCWRRPVRERIVIFKAICKVPPLLVSSQANFSDLGSMSSRRSARRRNLESSSRSCCVDISRYEQGVRARVARGRLPRRRRTTFSPTSPNRHQSVLFHGRPRDPVRGAPPLARENGRKRDDLVLPHEGGGEREDPPLPPALELPFAGTRRSARVRLVQPLRS